MESLGPARYLAISGNIGTGKSTLIEFLTQHFSIRPLFEPNEQNPFIADFYADMPRWAFHSQVFFLIQKFKLHQEMANASSPVVLDRTIYEDAEIFATNLARTGILSGREYETYWSLYQTLVALLRPPDLLIYLRCSLDTIRRRIAQRGRPEERALPDDYLKRLNRLYDRWFTRYDRSPTIVIRTDRIDYVSDLVDQVEMIKTVERVLLR